MSHLAKFSIVLIITIGLFDAAWMIFVGFGFNWQFVEIPLALAVIMFVASYVFSSVWPIRPLAKLTLWFGLILCFSLVSATSNFLVTTLNFAPKDGWISGLDLAMGLDWQEILRGVVIYPWAGAVSTAIYSSAIYLIALTMLYLSFSGREKRLELSFVSLMIASQLTIWISAPLTAIGPYLYFDVPFALYREYAPSVLAQGPDSLFVHHYTGLRDGSVRIIDLEGYTGLVQFPSFHTAMSVLIVVALRGCGPVFWVSAGLHGSILLTIPFEGNHYFADVWAGAFVALLAWHLTCLLDRRLTLWGRQKQSDTLQGGFIASRVVHQAKLGKRASNVRHTGDPR